MTQFSDLGLIQPILTALAAEGYTAPTPIQAKAIPHLLTGRDLIGIAQTGTGKTAAFALPILQHLAAAGGRAQPNSCRVLVLSPTRELATQIADSFRTYGSQLKPSVAVVFGGVGHRPQAEKLARGVDILVATPGRLIDHLESSRFGLGKTEIFVLDEADRMLDMGFIQPIRRIARTLPSARQSLFFSATMPKEIRALAAEFVKEPVEVSVTPPSSTAERIAQRVMFVETSRKRVLLTEVLREEPAGRTLVFTRTKHGADRVVKQLAQDGIAAAAIHGNKSQSQREKALDGFRSGKTPILIATDIAARGIDVDGVTHVINYDLPNIAESYVHRIGRTARAGAEGIAISFCDGEERAYLRDIEKLTRQSIPALDRRLAGGQADAPRAAAPNADAARNGRGRPAQRQEQPRRQEGRSHEGRSQEARRQDGRRQEPRRQDARPHDPRRQERAAQEPRRQERPRHAVPARPAQPAAAGTPAELSRLSFLQPQRRPQAGEARH